MCFASGSEVLDKGFCEELLFARFLALDKLFRPRTKHKRQKSDSPGLGWLVLACFGLGSSLSRLALPRLVLDWLGLPGLFALPLLASPCLASPRLCVVVCVFVCAFVCVCVCLCVCV